MPQRFGAPGNTLTAEDNFNIMQTKRVHGGMIDKHCNEIKRKTQGMTEYEANMWFCVDSEEAKQVFDHEFLFATVYHNGVLSDMPTHHIRCLKWRNKKWSEEDAYNKTLIKIERSDLSEMETAKQIGMIELKLNRTLSFKHQDMD